MNVKKSIAVIAAAATLCASAVTAAAIENLDANINTAEQVKDVQQAQTEDTAGTTDETDNNDSTTSDGTVPTEEQGIINEEQYATLTAEQKENFYKITVDDNIYACINSNNDEHVLTGTLYIQKNVFTWILISVRYDIYEKSDILINGEKVELTPNGDNTACTIPYDVETYQGNELNIKMKWHTEDKGIISADEYETLTDEQKANFFKINFPKEVAVSWTYGGKDDVIWIESGSYLNRNEWDNNSIYACVLPNIYAEHEFLVNEEFFDVTDKISGGGNFGNFLKIENYIGDELNIVVWEDLRGMVSSEEYSAMPEIRKNSYIKLNISNDAFASMQNKVTEETVTLEDGIYVAKTMEYVYIGVYPEIYKNNDIYVNGEKYDVELSGDGSSNYGKKMYIGDYSGKEITVEIKERTVQTEDTVNGNNTSANVLSPVPVTSADTAAEAKITNEISNTSKSNAAIDVSETGVTPDMLTAFSANKRAKTLTAKYSSSFMVKIAKEDVDAENAEALDFSVSGKKFISNKQIANVKALKNSEKIIQLDFSKKGELTGVDKVTVRTRTNIQDDGKTAVIYELVDGKLKKVGVCTIKARGFAEFETDHLGQFVIVVK